MATNVEIMVNTAFAGDYKGALSLCAQIYTTPDTDQVASYISGYCHFHLSDFETAITHFRNALDLHPQDPYSLYYNVASKYYAGHKTAALHDATLAIETWPAGQSSDEFKGLLQTALKACDDLSDSPSTAAARQEFNAQIARLEDLPFDLQLDVFLSTGAIEKANTLAQTHRETDRVIKVSKIQSVADFVQSGQGRFLYQAPPEVVAFEKITTTTTADRSERVTTETIPAPANPGYVAELRNVTVCGTSSAVFGTAGEVVSDTYAHALYGQYLDFRADEKIIRQKGDNVVIWSDENPKTLEYAINLMGLASNHFGHWFSEYLPRLRHFVHLDGFQDIPILINSDMPSSHFDFLRILCPNPVIEIERDEAIRVQRLLVAPTITFYPFDLITGHQVPPEHQASWSAAAMQFLRDKVLAALAPETRAKRSIYLSRKNSTWGKPTNEAEFEELLAARSIEPVCLEDMNFKEQVETIYSADVIIAPTGSALNMGMFAHLGARIFVFSQKAPHNWGGWLGPMKGVGLNPQFLMMQEGSALGKHAPYSMDIDALTRALDDT